MFQIKTTTSNDASTTVTTEDTYYITVVAYNAAFKPSDPVCSDGVTIDTSDSHIKELSISNARIRGGLVADSGEYWLISDDRSRKRIYNTTSCRFNVMQYLNLSILKDNKLTFVFFIMSQFQSHRRYRLGFDSY